MNTLQRGFSLLEAMAALAIGAMMMVGVATLMEAPLEETQGQQAALHQLQVTNAAAQYLADNYQALTAAATATVPVPVTMTMLRDAGYLSAGFADTNAYGQTPCVLVLQPDANKLDALIVTEGGNAIPARTLPYVAANAGQGGGYIESSGGNLVARGAFGSSTVSSATLANYLSANCSGTAASAERLANSLFYGGPGQPSTDFLYRDAVPGRPELNRMNTPLQIQAANAVENSSTDPQCAAGDNTTWGRFVVNQNGVILSCQAGTWRRPPNLHWRDPVASYAALPAAGNEIGDVRMVTGLQRAFTWNVDGAGVGSWVALAVDENGVLKTDFVQLDQVVAKGGACAPNGLLARDADGLILSCQSGNWDTQSTTELGSSDTGCMRIRPSVHSIPADETNCPDIFPQAAIVYVGPYDTYYATISRNLTLTKNGMISIGAWTLFSRGLVSDPSVSGMTTLTALIRDGNGNLVASSIAKTPYLTNTSTGINVPLAKALPKGSYTVELVAAYSIFDGGTQNYNESNFTMFDGSTLQETPLMTGWNIDVFY